MKKTIASFFCLLLSLLLYGKTFSFNYNVNDKYNVTIKANVKIYINDKYIGLNSKEIKAVMHIKDIIDGNFLIEGNIYKLDKTMRDNNPIGYKIDAMSTSGFSLNSTGYSDSKNKVFPILQNIPNFPDRELNPGDTFENYGKALVSINNDLTEDILPIIVTTKYIGKSDFYGVMYDLFEINYGYVNQNTNNNISKSLGLHKIKFYFDSIKGLPVYMDDHFTEEFTLLDKSKIKKSGFYIYFYRPIIKMNKEDIIKDLTSDIVLKNNQLLNDLDFKKKEVGISITINNLKFKPDSVDLIENERDKIKAISDMLIKIKNRTFMVIGHTALSGTKEEQYKLSLDRAMAIKNLLIENGIEPQKILFTGKGADDPVAPNDTEENKQKNRRVEIVILED